MTKRCVWLSGRFMDPERARVPATSLAVTHGVGAFETMRIVRGHAPLIALHAARLATTCRALDLPLEPRDWGSIVAELARRNGLANGVVRLTVGPEFALATTRRHRRGLATERREGVGLQTLKLQRGAAGIKSTSWLPLVLAERTAGDEVLLTGERGALLEATRSNFFALTSRGLETAPTPLVLPGIGRGLVVELARGLGIKVIVRAPQRRAIPEFREAFITNAVAGVRPVHSIDATRFAVRRDSLCFELQRQLDARMGLRRGSSPPAPAPKRRG